MKKHFFFALLVIVSTGLLSCSKEKDSDMATLHVRLTDAPGAYEAVNVEVKGIQVPYAQGDTSAGWQAFPMTSRVYNLLDLSNGKDTLLGSMQLPVGKISQIRLLLGNNNSVTVGGVTYPLATPSAQQSGLKLKVKAELIRDIDYTVLLDFDAGRSIVQTGTGAYKLKPVLRTITTATSGAIRGTVSPAAARPLVYAIHGPDTVSAPTNAEGQFLVKGLNAGKYNLLFVPRSPYATTELANVDVTVGTVKNIGTIQVTE